MLFEALWSPDSLHKPGIVPKTWALKIALVSRMFDCSDPEERGLGLAAAVAAAKQGGLVVMPTDTVYGIGADAFTPHAVANLLAAKRRGRDMPVPVLIGDPATLAGLASHVVAEAQQLVTAFWPGALTLVLPQVATLAWDLGETDGTVAVRMPDHPLTLQLLREAGPMAVSSANISGEPPARTAADAREQLGDFVSVYLEDGPAAGSVPSTIVDVSGEQPRVLRVGAIGMGALREVVPAIILAT